MGAVYQRDPEMLPDSDFEPGQLHHLVIGNKGRLLDARRTPIQVVDLRPELAWFVVEVLGFEDRGARWELPMDTVDHFQFDVGSTRAEPESIADFERAIQCFDGEIDIAVDSSRREATMARLDDERIAAATWFEEQSTWARGDRVLDLGASVGDPRLFDDLDRYMAARDLTAVETGFSQRYVSNPGAGEEVRGHLVVIAELGLASYHGRAVRDPATFTGRWSRQGRADHIVARLAFVSTMFALAGHASVDLHRGMAFEGAFDWRPRGPLVSATFRRSVAEAQAELGPHRSMAMFTSQRVAVDRLLMSFHETRAMNDPFQESEALVLASPSAVF